MLAVLTISINQSALYFSLCCLFFFVLFPSYDAQFSAQSSYSYVLSAFFTSVGVLLSFCGRDDFVCGSASDTPWASSSDPGGASESVLSLLLLVKSRKAELIFCTDQMR
jgi:hypothetical protein